MTLGEQIAKLAAWCDDVQLSNRIGVPTFNGPSELKQAVSDLIASWEARGEVVKAAAEYAEAVPGAENLNARGITSSECMARIHRRVEAGYALRQALARLSVAEGRRLNCRACYGSGWYTAGELCEVCSGTGLAVVEGQEAEA